MSFHSIKKRADFLAARHAPAAGTRAFLLVAHGRGDDAPPRFGLTVTKKIGSAVTRNRVKRRLRAAIYEALHGDISADDIDSAQENRKSGGTAAPLGAGFRPGTDYILIARQGVLTRPFPALLDDIKGALLRLSEKPK